MLQQVDYLKTNKATFGQNSTSRLVEVRIVHPITAGSSSRKAANMLYAPATMWLPRLLLCSTASHDKLLLLL